MGSSKIIFVGAVAVVVGIFGFGIKKAEKESAQIAAVHAYKLQAKTLADQGLNLAVRRLPTSIGSVTPRAEVRTTNEGTFGYSSSVSDFGAGKVTVVAYGISNGQRANVTSVVQNFPAGTTLPAGTKAWNRWKLLSSVRTFTTQ